jgi:hypothetical protein
MLLAIRESPQGQPSFTSSLAMSKWAHIPILAVLLVSSCALRIADPPIVMVAPEYRMLYKQACAIHERSKYARRYPFLEKVGPRENGQGLEVQFRQPDGRKGVAYYFDSAGKYERCIRVHLYGY